MYLLKRETRELAYIYLIVKSSWRDADPRTIRNALARTRCPSSNSESGEERTKEINEEPINKTASVVSNAEGMEELAQTLQHSLITGVTITAKI